MRRLLVVVAFICVLSLSGMMAGKATGQSATPVSTGIQQEPITNGQADPTESRSIPLSVEVSTQSSSSSDFPVATTAFVAIIVSLALMTLLIMRQEKHQED